jgi:hypothetical protein
LTYNPTLLKIQNPNHNFQKKIGKKLNLKQSKPKILNPQVSLTEKLRFVADDTARFEVTLITNQTLGLGGLLECTLNDIPRNR